jgi:hypothetical protein
MRHLAAAPGGALKHRNQARSLSGREPHVIWPLGSAADLHPRARRPPTRYEECGPHSTGPRPRAGTARHGQKSPNDSGSTRSIKSQDQTSEAEIGADRDKERDERKGLAAGEIGLPAVRPHGLAAGDDGRSRDTATISAFLRKSTFALAKQTTSRTATRTTLASRRTSDPPTARRTLRGAGRSGRRRLGAAHPAAVVVHAAQSTIGPERGTIWGVAELPS